MLYWKPLLLVGLKSDEFKVDGLSKKAEDVDFLHMTSVMQMSLLSCKSSAM